MTNWLNYVTHYIKLKTETRLYQRYVANFIGKYVGAEKSYDDILEELDSLTSNKKQRTASEIRQDFLVKFSKGD